MFYRYSMVRSYVRKSRQAQYSENDTATTVSEMRSGKICRQNEQV